MARNAPTQQKPRGSRLLRKSSVAEHTGCDELRHCNASGDLEGIDRAVRGVLALWITTQREGTTYFDVTLPSAGLMSKTVRWIFEKLNECCSRYFSVNRIIIFGG